MRETGDFSFRLEGEEQNTILNNNDDDIGMRAITTYIIVEYHKNRIYNDDTNSQ